MPLRWCASAAGGAGHTGGHGRAHGSILQARVTGGLMRLGATNGRAGGRSGAEAGHARGRGAGGAPDAGAAADQQQGPADEPAAEPVLHLARMPALPDPAARCARLPGLVCLHLLLARMPSFRKLPRVHAVDTELYSSPGPVPARLEPVRSHARECRNTVDAFKVRHCMSINVKAHPRLKGSLHPRLHPALAWRGFAWTCRRGAAGAGRTPRMEHRLRQPGDARCCCAQCCWSWAR